MSSNPSVATLISIGKTHEVGDHSICKTFVSLERLKTVNLTKNLTRLTISCCLSTPNLPHPKCNPQSRDIYVVRLSKAGNKPRKAIFLEGGLHARYCSEVSFHFPKQKIQIFQFREWISPASLLFLLNDLLRWETFD